MTWQVTTVRNAKCGFIVKILMGLAFFRLKKKRCFQLCLHLNSSKGAGYSFFLSRQKLEWRTWMEVRMAIKAQWNELSLHHCVIHFSFFLLCLGLLFKTTTLTATSWEPLQSNFKQYMITAGLKDLSSQSSSSCVRSGPSARMIALQASPTSSARK